MSPTELINAHLDNALDDAGRQELEAWLVVDRSHQERFMRAVLDHRALLGLHAAPREPAMRERRPRPHLSVRRARGRTAPAVGWYAIAASVLVVLGAFLWLRPAATAAVAGPLIVAADATTVQQDGRAIPLLVGNAVPAGAAVAAGNGLTLRFADGSTVTLSAGTVATVDADRVGVHLERGLLTAEVAPQPGDRPAVFATPDALVTVVGTALAVARDDGRTQVSVTHGLVSVQRTADGATVRVAAGEQCAVAAQGPLTISRSGAPTGRLLTVGPGQAYPTLAAVPDPAAGDVIEIHAGTYREARTWPAAGTRGRPVTIRAAAGARPVIDGAGLVLTGQGSTPRALLQIAGGNYVIAGLEFTNGRNGELAAAIRSIATESLIVRDCRITACDLGIDTAADEVQILDCEVGDCGDSAAPRATNSLRLIGHEALVRGCWIHDTHNGASLRSGVERLRLEANRISGGEEGVMMLAGEPGSVQHATVIGNLLLTGTQRPGNHSRFIGVEQGIAQLELLSNTCVTADPRVVFLSAITGQHRVTATDTIFAGSDALAGPGIMLTGQRNWYAPTATVPGGLTKAVPSTGADPGFSAPGTGDYRLTAGSSGRGTASAAAPPIAWEPPPMGRAGAVPRARSDDLGAFAASPR